MKYLVALSAIGAIAWLDTTALKAGIDGVAMTTCVGMIAGIGTVFFLPSKDRAKALETLGRKGLLVLFAPLALLAGGCSGADVSFCVENDKYGKACIVIGGKRYVEEKKPDESPSPSPSPAPSPPAVPPEPK